ncbi:ExbD/TolR family protein [Sphingomicrobium astaxanthinifaciens]|uniref:ExbD/TolR family protein n=1 Tax=Sphingomicrobium astaxanthinifaciens TaxID=1227949 RepID=UPI001FCAB9A7|nr:ExbD/TolR family protein [Sphingomicrobium astaxanthinifaciens]MCJ7420896.1 ExbD/TolR family protein [Sphingomicrobium astaxanthinifaciens]
MAMGLASGGRGRRRGRRARRAPMAEINVTPFVDVMLVLLIIFMVTAPLLVAGVAVDLPESRAETLDQSAEPVQLSIDRDGVISIDDLVVPEDALADRLAAIAEEPAPPEGRRIYLRADRRLDYGRVMRVVGELNAAGLNRVALVSVGEGAE